MRAAVDKVRERGVEVIAISDDDEFLASAETPFSLVRGTPEWLTPLLTVVPGQVAAVAPGDVARRRCRQPGWADEDHAGPLAQSRQAQGST